MPALDATLESASANSYDTVAEANTILNGRLYTGAWTGAGTTPNAQGYTVTSSVSYGASSVAIENGTGNFTVGSVVTFAGDTTEYTVGAVLSGAGSLSISPALVVSLLGGEAVTRGTAYEKEQALIWATFLLDQTMVWYGYKTTQLQALRWPRTGVTDPDGYEYDWHTIPTILKAAIAELALSLLQSNKFTPPAGLGQGVSEVQAGPLKVKMDPSAVMAVVSDNILALLSPLGYLEGAAQTGASVIPLERS